MRIAIVTEVFLPKEDGITLLLSRLLSHLRANSPHDILVFAPGYALPTLAGFPVARAIGIPLGVYPGLHFNWFSPLLAARLVHFKPDLVHFFDPVLMGSQAMSFCVAFLPHVRRVVGWHTNAPMYAKMFGYEPLGRVQWDILRAEHAAAHVSLVPSQSVKNELEERGVGGSVVRIWGRGVDGVLFDPAKRDEGMSWRWMNGGVFALAGNGYGNGYATNVYAKNHAGYGTIIPGDVKKRKTILLYVGRISWEKGLQTLWSAYMAMDHSRVHLVVVGDGPARMEFLSQFPPSIVTATGWLRGEELATAFASADIFVYPSTSETFGNVVMEAQASGLPVVAYRSLGVQDIVRDGETGFLVPQGDMVAFKTAIQTLVADEGKRKEMSVSARKFATQWGWFEAMSECTDAYEEAFLVEIDESKQRIGTRLWDALQIFWYFFLQCVLGVILGFWRSIRFGQIRATPPLEIHSEV